MNFLPKRFFDSANSEGANSGGGEGAATLPAETKIENPTESSPAETPAAEVPKQIFTDEELKGFGFDSADALKTFLQKQKESNIPEEEKLEKANIEKANFLKYAAENKLFKVEEYNQAETLKTKSDRELVFEKHLSEYKADHPEITDEDELKEAAEEDFNYEYKLNSENETAKKRAEAKLSKEAKELRTPYESKIATAQEKFKEDSEIRQNLPKFEKFVDDIIIKNTPDEKVVGKLKIGDEDVEVKITLTKEDRAAIAKTFKSPKAYQDFITGKPEEIQTKIDKKIDGWILANKKEEILNTTLELGKGIGTKQGSSTGADNSFPLKQGSAAVINMTSETMEESNRKLSEAKLKYQQGRR